MNSKTKKHIFLYAMLALSVAMYVAYLFMPAISFGVNKFKPGWYCVATVKNTFEFCHPWYMFYAWLANPVWMVGLVLFYLAVHRESLRLSWWTFAVATLAVCLGHMIHIPFNSGVLWMKMVYWFDTHLAPGVHMWLGAMSVLFIASIVNICVLLWKGRRKQ